MSKRDFWQQQAKRWPVVLLLPLLFLLLFFFYPLGNIFRLSLTAEALVELVQRPSFRNVIWFTVWQATLSTGLTLLLGLPAAYLFARYEFRGKAILRALTTIPFVMPTVVVAAAFRALLGANGPLNRLLTAVLQTETPPIQLEHTLTIILLAHVFYNVTVVVRLVGGFWGNLNPRLVEAAQTLGASPRRAFWEITLPLIRPSLISASLLIYLFTFTSFGVVLILGGPAFSTIETEIYRQYITFLRPDVAAALSLLQIVFTFGLMSLYAKWQQQTAVSLDFRPQESTQRQPQTAGEKLALGGMVTGLLLFLLTPLLALVWQSLVDREGQFTLAYYQALPTLRRDSIVFVPPLTALRNSLGYALLTVIVAGVLGLFSATFLIRPLRHASTSLGRSGQASRWRSWLDPLFMLPLGASAVTLGFGYVVTFRWLRTSPLLVLIAHVLVAFPFVVRTLLPAAKIAAASPHQPESRAPAPSIPHGSSYFLFGPADHHDR